MTQEKLKQFLDACFDAKRLIEKLPDLPDGMKPRQVHVLDAVNEIQKKQGFCRVSDISSYMNTTLPSITKLVQELEERNLLVKQADEKDKRVINLTLTEEGKEFVELRVTHFHGEWASRLPDLDDAVVDEFVHAITRMQETMPGIKGVKNKGKRNSERKIVCRGTDFPVPDPLCAAGARRADSAGGLRCGRPSRGRLVRRCVEYFRCRNRKQLHADGNIYHHQPCDGFDRYDRPAHWRGQAG